ncbi:MAG: Fic family protein [Deltaproteobacteria bacterium]|nr:Fic family protein [Deltaproteobacteria bacterium]
MNHEELSARLHHRLVWIHPFENGNGRWARLIMNIHLKKYNLP